MKPSSIVSIIVAAVIIVIGIVTCAIANGMAEKSGNLLFARSRGDDYINTVDLNEKEIIRISLDLTDADVNIYGSSTTSYIEFVNFRETLYSLTASSTSVQFSESPDFSSMLKFWEGGFSFKGMRYIFSPRTYDDSRMKAVNIYLSSDCEIKQFNITANRASVTLENLSCDADYIFNVNEIDLFASSVKTNSTLRINMGSDTSSEAPAESVKARFESTTFTNVLINADWLSLNGTTNGIMNTKIFCKSGNIDWSLPNYALSAPLTDVDFSFTTDGSLTVNGEEHTSPFTYTDESDEVRYTYKISAGDADVNISSLSLQADNTLPESTDQDDSDTPAVP